MTETLVWILALSLISWVTLGRLSDLSEPNYLICKVGSNVCLADRWDDLQEEKCLPQYTALLHILLLLLTYFRQHMLITMANLVIIIND